MDKADSFMNWGFNPQNQYRNINSPPYSAVFIQVMINELENDCRYKANYVFDINKFRNQTKEFYEAINNLERKQKKLNECFAYGIGVAWGYSPNEIMFLNASKDSFRLGETYDIHISKYKDLNHNMYEFIEDDLNIFNIKSSMEEGIFHVSNMDWGAR